MVEHPRGLIALRALVVAGALAIIAGCGAAGNKSSAQVPPPPSGLSALAGDAVVTLGWSPSSDATGYHVKRAVTSGGPYTQLDAPDATAYADASAANGARYFYVVSAVDAAGESADSAEVSATPEAPSAPPAAPTNLRATGGDGQATLAWSASSGATSYNVERSTVSGGPYAQLAAASSPPYTDRTASNGTEYYYVVSAVDSGGESADSAEVTVIPDPVTSIPAIPMGLVASAGNGQAILTWSASSGATSYHVKRATASEGPYAQVNTPSSTTYTDTSVTNGTTYYYVVSALDSAGESADSAPVSALPAAPIVIPAAPANFSASAGNALVTLSWSPSAGAGSYHVKRATQSGGPYAQIAALPADTYTDPSLINGSTYYYVVSAVNSAGESPNSVDLAATPVARHQATSP